MKQQDIFEYAAQGCYGGGFVIGGTLPRLKGRLSSFHIISMDAIPQETTPNFLSRIITSYEETPSRKAEERSRQIKNLFTATIQKKKKIIVVINSAELLPVVIIHALKSLREIVSEENFYPGIVLLGKTGKIIDSISNEKGIASSSVKISDTGFIALKSTNIKE